MTDSLSVGLVARIFNNVPVWAAQQLGLFGDAGLDVTATVLYGVGNVTQAVRDGACQVGVGTPESVLSDPDLGGGLTIVGGNARTLSNGLIARRGITSVQDLRGGRIGVSHPREGTALLVGEMLAAHGLQRDRDYRLLAVGVAGERWEQIQDGTLDAGLQTPPHKYLAEELGYANLGDVFEYVPDYQFTTLNVRRPWARESREVLTRFLACLSAATQWLYDEPDAAIDLATEALETTVDHVRRDYEHFVRTRSLTADLGLSAPGMAKVISLMHQVGTLASPGVDQSARIDLSFLPAPLSAPPAP